MVIFAATRREFHAVQRALTMDRRTRIGGRRAVIGRRGSCGVILVQTGIGSRRAAEACRDVLRDQSLGTIDAVISSGYACSLVPSEIGDLLIGTEVIGEASDERKGCSRMLVDAAVQAAEKARLPVRTGRIAAVSHIVCSAAEKRALAGTTGAVGLDMESGAMGAAAAEANVPFAVVRAVSDAHDEDLPVDFNLFLRPTGWASGLMALARSGGFRGLLRLRRQTVRADERLTTFFNQWLDDMSTPAPC